MTSNGKNGHLGDDDDQIPGFEEVEIVHTSDEEGNVHIFEKLDEIEVDGQDYALLIYRGTEAEVENAEHGDVKIKHTHKHHHEDGQPCTHHHGDDEDDDEESDDEVVVMRISYEDGLQVYENIDDEDEFEKVVQAIENLELEGEGEEIDIVALGQLLNELEEDSEASTEPSEFEKHKQKKEQQKKEEE